MDQPILEKPGKTLYMEPNSKFTWYETSLERLYDDINRIVANISHEGKCEIKHKQGKWKWTFKYPTVNVSDGTSFHAESLPLKFIISVFSSNVGNTYYIEVQRRSGDIIDFYRSFNNIKTVFLKAHVSSILSRALTACNFMTNIITNWSSYVIA